MTVAAFIYALLNALVAIPKIGDLVTSAVSGAVMWYVSRQNNETLSEIADAAAMAARATTDDERYKAAEAWQKALQRPRVSA